MDRVEINGRYYTKDDLQLMIDYYINHHNVVPSTAQQLPLELQGDILNQLPSCKMISKQYQQDIQPHEARYCQLPLTKLQVLYYMKNYINGITKIYIDNGNSFTFQHLHGYNLFSDTIIMKNNRFKVHHAQIELPDKSEWFVNAYNKHIKSLYDTYPHAIINYNAYVSYAILKMSHCSSTRQSMLNYINKYNITTITTPMDYFNLIKAFIIIYSQINKYFQFPSDDRFKTVLNDHGEVISGFDFNNSGMDITDMVDYINNI